MNLTKFYMALIFTLFMVSQAVHSQHHLIGTKLALETQDTLSLQNNWRYRKYPGSMGRCGAYCNGFTDGYAKCIFSSNTCNEDIK